MIIPLENLGEQDVTFSNQLLYRSNGSSVGVEYCTSGKVYYYDERTANWVDHFLDLDDNVRYLEDYFYLDGNSTASIYVANLRDLDSDLASILNGKLLKMTNVRCDERLTLGCLLFYVNASVETSTTTDYDECSEPDCLGLFPFSPVHLEDQSGLKGFCSVGLSFETQQEYLDGVISLPGSLFADWCLGFLENNWTRKKCMNAKHECVNGRSRCVYWYSCNYNSELV